MNPFNVDATPIMYADGTAIKWEDPIATIKWEELLYQWPRVITTTESSSTYVHSGASKVAKMSGLDEKCELSFVSNMEKFVNELAST